MIDFTPSSSLEQELMKSFHLRFARKEDFEDIAEVLFEAYKDAAWFKVINAKVSKPDWIRTTNQSMQNIAESPDGTSIVVETDGKIIGTACYLHLTAAFPGLPDPGDTPGENEDELEKMGSGLFKDELIERYGAVLWISEAAVHPLFQRKGVGRLLLSFILGEAKRRHLNIAAAVDGSANVPKILEEKLGFVEVHPVRMLLDGKVPSVGEV